MSSAVDISNELEQVCSLAHLKASREAEVQTWTWPHRGHRVGGCGPLLPQKFGHGPSLLDNCYLENRFYK